jgi:hypothetical protein
MPIRLGELSAIISHAPNDFGGPDVMAGFRGAQQIGIQRGMLDQQKKDEEGRNARGLADNQNRLDVENLKALNDAYKRLSDSRTGDYNPHAAAILADEIKRMGGAPPADLNEPTVTGPEQPAPEAQPSPAAPDYGAALGFGIPAPRAVGKTTAKALKPQEAPAQADQRITQQAAIAGRSAPQIDPSAMPTPDAPEPAAAPKQVGGPLGQIPLPAAGPRGTGQGFGMERFRQRIEDAQKSKDPDAAKIAQLGQEAAGMLDNGLRVYGKSTDAIKEAEDFYSKGLANLTAKKVAGKGGPDGVGDDERQAFWKSAAYVKQEDDKLVAQEADLAGALENLMSGDPTRINLGAGLVSRTLNGVRATDKDYARIQAAGGGALKIWTDIQNWVGQGSQIPPAAIAQLIAYAKEAQTAIDNRRTANAEQSDILFQGGTAKTKEEMQAALRQSATGKKGDNANSPTGGY